MAGWLDSDVPGFLWLRDDGVDKGQKIMQGLQFGFNMARQKTADEMSRIRMQTELEAMQLRREQFALDRESKLQVAQGYTELGQIAATITASPGGWSDPINESRFYAVAQKYPWVMREPGFGRLEQNFADARKAAEKAKEPTAAVQNAQAITALESEAAQLETAGDTAGATAKRQQAELVKATMLSGNESIEVGKDGTFKITRGAAAGKSGGPITTGTQSKVEQDLHATRDSLSLMEDLQSNLRWQDVGVAGVFGEHVLDKLLPQAGITSHDPKRTDNRTKLKTLVQGMLRQVSPDNRFTNEDRKRVEAITPSDGVFENVGHAKTVLATLQRVFALRNIRDMQLLGKPITLESLNNAEIGAAVEMKLIPLEEAKAELIRRFEQEGQ